MLKDVSVTYGGTPQLLKSTTNESNAPILSAMAAKPAQKKISKFAWSDESAKVKIYIETNQFDGEILEAMVDVTFDTETCVVNVVDAGGVCHILNIDK